MTPLQQPATAPLTANGRCDTWAPCALCQFTDTELPDLGVYGQLEMGATCECEDCGALLTFTAYDYWTDLGAAYTWTATEPTPAATWSAFQRASEWRHREDESIKHPERYSTDAPWGWLGGEVQQQETTS